MVQTAFEDISERGHERTAGYLRMFMQSEDRSVNVPNGAEAGR